jgi:integrase
MHTEIDRLARFEDIRRMEASKANKKIVFDFDRLNEINGLTPSTRAGYLVLLKHLLAYCNKKEMSLKQLKGDDIREFMSLLKERKITTQVGRGMQRSRRIDRLSQGCMNSYIQMTKRFFKYLYGTGRDSPKVLRDADLRQKQTEFKLTSADLPTEEEILAMIEATPNPLYRAIIAVAYDSGMRINDILDLKVQDLMISENEVRLRFYIRKARKHLLYGMGSSVGYLMNWYNLHPTKEPQDPLFCTTATNHRGKRMGYTNIYRIIKRLAKKAGIPKSKNVTCHTFRHCATKRDKHQYTDEELRILRGWTRRSTMPLRYAPIAADEVFKKKQVLEGKIRPEQRKKVIDARSCPRCRNTVAPDMAYCCVCGQLLSKQPSEIHEILAGNPDIMQRIVSEVTENVERRMKFKKLAEERFRVMLNE